MVPYSALIGATKQHAHMAYKVKLRAFRGLVMGLDVLEKSREHQSFLQETLRNKTLNEY